MSRSFQRAVLAAALLILAPVGFAEEGETNRLSGDSQPANGEISPLLLEDYYAQRDEEYIGYLEALDLTEQYKKRLWEHLTRKYEALAQLDGQVAANLGEPQRDEVDLLVIAYDPDNEYVQRLERLRKEMEDELRIILSDQQIEQARTHKQAKEQERQSRRLRHDLEDMELDLSAIQYAAAADVLYRKPLFQQEWPDHPGASGFSTEYIQEHERWRFEQEQEYLEANLVPLLNRGQKDRFKKWQEIRKLELERNLDRYRETQALLARLYPEHKRKIRIIRPEHEQVLEAGRPVYVECRNNDLFLVPIKEIRTRALDELRTLSRQAGGEPGPLLELLSRADVGADGYRVDISSILLARFSLRTLPENPGHRWTGREENPWFDDIIRAMKNNHENLILLVRPSGRVLAEHVRSYAEQKNVPVSVELLEDDQPMLFWLSGLFISPEKTSVTSRK